MKRKREEDTNNEPGTFSLPLIIKWIDETNNLVEAGKILEAKTLINQIFDIAESKNISNLNLFMHVASYQGHGKLVKFLLDNGAEVSAEINHYTALTIAVERYLKIIDVIEKEKTEEKEIIKQRENYKQIIRILKAEGANLDEIWKLEHSKAQKLYFKFLKINEIKVLEHYKEETERKEDNTEMVLSNDIQVTLIKNNVTGSSTINIEAKLHELINNLDNLENIFSQHSSDKIEICIDDYYEDEDNEYEKISKEEGYLTGFRKGDIQALFKTLNKTINPKIELHIKSSFCDITVQELCEQLKTNDRVQKIFFDTSVIIDNNGHKMLAEFLRSNKSIASFINESDSQVKYDEEQYYNDAFQHNRTLLEGRVYGGISGYVGEKYEYRNKNYFNAVLNNFEEIMNFDSTKGFGTLKFALYKLLQVAHKKTLADRFINSLISRSDKILKNTKEGDENSNKFDQDVKDFLKEIDNHNNREHTIKINKNELVLNKNIISHIYFAKIVEKCNQVDDYIQNNFLKIAGIKSSTAKTMIFNFVLTQDKCSNYEEQKNYYLNTQNTNIRNQKISSNILEVIESNSNNVDFDHSELNNEPNNVDKNSIQISMEFPDDLIKHIISFLGPNSLWALKHDFTQQASGDLANIIEKTVVLVGAGQEAMEQF